MRGWKWGYGGGHTLSKNARDIEGKITNPAWSYQYLPSTKGTKFESPFPMLFGIIKDGNIDSMDIYSYSTGTNQSATVIKVDAQIKLWYQIITEEQGEKFKISALTNDNHIINTKEVDEGSRSGESNH